MLKGRYTESIYFVSCSPRAESFPAERELRGKQVQILRGPATVTDKPVSDTTDNTACAEAFGKVEKGIWVPSQDTCMKQFFLAEDQKKNIKMTAANTDCIIFLLDVMQFFVFQLKNVFILWVRGNERRWWKEKRQKSQSEVFCPLSADCRK